MAKSAKGRGASRKSKAGGLQQRMLRWALYAIGGAVLFLFLLFGAVYVGLFGALPTAEDIKAIKNNNASEVLSQDGKLLGKYFIQNRSSVSYADIPAVVIDALIATEDSRFFEHEGIDFYSIPRVVIKTMLLGDRSAGGGSTISQQLAKNVFGRERYGALSLPVNKLKENITALKLEEVYSKEEIVTLYLNTVSFGENVYGIKAASQRYFNKVPRQLSTVEAATLVGMLKATTTYNPRLHPQAARERRNTVLSLMARQGSLAESELDALMEQELKVEYTRLEGQFGLAPYFRAQIEQQINELLKPMLKEDGNPYNLYADGLKIEVSLHSVLQRKAEQSVAREMKRLQQLFTTHWQGRKPWGKDERFLWQEAARSRRYERLKAQGKSEAEIRKDFNTPRKLLVYGPDSTVAVLMTPLDSVAYHQMVLQTGFFAMNARSGEVLAYVGGVDFGYFPYDHVYSRRQAGSTFKPLVYAAALTAGYSPCDYVENEPLVMSAYENWSPENADGVYGGYYSLRGGLAYSVNTVAARLIANVGVEPVRELARKAGISGGLPRVPALALGAADVSLAEIVQAYTPFVNEGKSVAPLLIKKISDAEGKVLYEAPGPRYRRVLDESLAAEMRSMLQTVVDSGTARSLRGVYGVDVAVGGKTGTTQYNSDGWFVAITPRVVCGAWVGAQSPRVRFRSTALGQGAATALPIVGRWLNAVEGDPAVPAILGRSFPELSDSLQAQLDCPLYVERRLDVFLDQLFGIEPETRDSSRSDSASKGWIGRLLDQLGK